MSRQGQLPPRCPIPKKPFSNPNSDTRYSSAPIESYIGHYKSPSQNSLLEDQPAWLDDLLSETADGNSKGSALRRSVSDSVMLMGDIMESLSGLNPIDDEESSVSGASGELESACVYGPSSPRTRNNSTFSGDNIASAISDYVSQKPHQYLDYALKGANHSDSIENARGSTGVFNAETKAAKRHPGQRSRVRKLQYIAELERTVAMLQNVEADLSVRVASLLQKRVALSLENSQLKQKMARLKQDKLIMEGEYQALKKEAQRLKSGLENSTNTMLGAYSSSINAAAKPGGLDINWKMLDMRKLNLN